MAKKIKGNLPRVTADEAKRILDHLDRRFVEYSGTFEEAEQALGFYLAGRHIGWKPLLLIHNKRTIRRFEEILNIEIRKEFPEVGPDAERSNAYRIGQKISNFWKAVSGDIKIEGRRGID